LKKKIKIGILLDNYSISFFVKDIVIWLKQNSNKFDIDDYIILESNQSILKKIITRKIFKKICFRFITIIESLILKISKYRIYLKTYDIRNFLNNQLVVTINSNKIEFINGDSIKNIREKKYDVLLRFSSSILKGDILDSSKYGIISFHHGDNNHYRGSPAGFWEVIHRKNSTGFIIQKLTNDLDNGDIFFKGWVQTKFFYLLNQIELYRKSNFYLKKTLENIFDEKDTFLTKSSKPGPIYETPGILKQIAYIFNTIWHLVKKYFVKSYNYKLAYSNSVNSSMKNIELKIIQPDKNTFLADPFLFKFNNKLYCFAEEFDKKIKKGKIVSFIISNGEFTQKTISLEESFHLSFPFIFNYKNQIFLCPDTSAINEIRIYRSIDFPKKWAFEKTLIKNIKATDTMIFEKDNISWLLTNIDRSNTNDFSHDLSIFYSLESPISDKWEEHKLNPISANSLNSRNAGLINLNNNFYRISQKQGFDRYGQDFSINKIENINKDNYSEFKDKTLESNLKENLKNYQNIHHLSILDNNIVFDFE